jgi:hypothetical protein
MDREQGDEDGDGDERAGRGGRCDRSGGTEGGALMPSVPLAYALDVASEDQRDLALALSLAEAADAIRARRAEELEVAADALALAMERYDDARIALVEATETAVDAMELVLVRRGVEPAHASAELVQLREVTL